MRCSKCQGTGFYIDFGLMRVDCDCPELYDPEPVPCTKVDRRSKSYKEAIDKIAKSNNCSRIEAVKVFDSEFQKIA